MIDFINANLDTIIGSTAVIATLFPLARQRILGDKKILTSFKTLEDVTSRFTKKEFDIRQSVTNLDSAIQKIEQGIAQEVSNMNESILAFQESELYTKMLDGLKQVDELQQRLENDALTIQLFGDEIKETKRLLEKIYNEVKG